MNASDGKKLANIKKKLKCNLENCGDNLNFTILDTQMRYLERENGDLKENALDAMRQLY